jgi:hypothetical protein
MDHLTNLRIAAVVSLASVRELLPSRAFGGQYFSHQCLLSCLVCPSEKGVARESQAENRSAKSVHMKIARLGSATFDSP